MQTQEILTLPRFLVQAQADLPTIGVVTILIDNELEAGQFCTV